VQDTFSEEYENIEVNAGVQDSRRNRWFKQNWHLAQKKSTTAIEKQ
jgi:hypothetical protein